jgi:hypothetical protein
LLEDFIKPTGVTMNQLSVALGAESANAREPRKSRSAFMKRQE